MTDKQAYAIFGDVLELQRKFEGDATLAEFIAAANELNAKHNANLCNALTEALRQWKLGKVLTVEADKLAEFYTDCWKLWKQFSGQERTDSFWANANARAKGIVAKYGVRQAEMFTLAVLDELEINGAEKT